MRGQPTGHTIAFRAKHLAASELIFGYLEGWIVARTPDGGENHEPGQLILTNQRLCLSASWMIRVVRLAFLSPGVVEAILEGKVRGDVASAAFIQSGAIPADWREQQALYLPKA